MWGRIKNKYKFPCGLEIESSTSCFSIANLFSTIGKDEIGVECPLHGKSCPKHK